MSGLVLSLFPGIGMLDHAFELEGFTVVRGPDPLWGGDIRDFHPPAGVFDGVIGGPPCQTFSGLANLVRAQGREVTFGDLIPDYARVINTARPAWFVMENVPKAYDPPCPDYGVASFMLDNSWLGEVQRRKRRIWFGRRGGDPTNLRQWIPGCALELCESAQSVTSDSRAAPERLGGGGKVKRTAVCGRDGRVPDDRRKLKRAPGDGRHDGAIGGPDVNYEPERRSLPDMLELQGLPGDWLEHQPWTMQAKRKMIGNGVPIPMGRAIARAVRKALI